MELRDFAEMQKIKKKTEYISNPNLLDNWYFADPINQRGKTNYTTGENNDYCIDRWKLGWNANLSVTGDGISHSTATQMWQPLTDELVDALTGKTVTVSILSNEGLYTDMGEFENINGSRMVVYINSPAFGTALVIKTKPAEVIIAVKLEIGEQQTLAHQENGVWMLNEIPNYAEQMAICSQYSPTSGEYLGAGVFIRHDTTGKLYRLGLDDNGLYTVEQS